ncbi:MAG: glycosyltransferase family 2 protein [Chitinivibrionia bacterium]|nr:glycosyltransferase family 2 protein [Chitinivibrionia bacterium]
MIIIDYFLSAALPIFLISLSTFVLFLKKTRSKKTRSANFTPKCNVFIPCKGVDDEFEKNIERFFQLSYPNYNLYFAVESENDPATLIIRKKIEFYKKGKLVISEETKFCGQKNLNLVRAVDESDEADIFIFADGDIAPNDNWLDFLICPLENPNITASSGFRWLYSKTNDLGSQVHSFQNYVLFVLFVVSAKYFNSGLWGGSMAIRKKDYDTLNVRARWLETSVDDLSLAEIVVKSKNKVQFSFDTITDTFDTIKTYNKTGKWFVRQVQYLKYHAKISWIFAFLLSALTLWFFARAFIICVFGIIEQNLAAFCAPILFLCGIFIFASMFCLFGVKGKMLSFVIYSPISLFNVCLCVVKTAFINFIDWSGYRYFIKFFNGKVWKVEKI